MFMHISIIFQKGAIKCLLILPCELACEDTPEENMITHFPLLWSKSDLAPFQMVDGGGKIKSETNLELFLHLREDLDQADPGLRQQVVPRYVLVWTIGHLQVRLSQICIRLKRLIRYGW